jgi:WD40 repeat protein
VLCGAFSRDGRLVATGGSDNTCRIWDASTGEPSTPAMRHDARVARVVFSPQYPSLLTESLDGRAYLWCTATGERLSPPLDPAGWVKPAFASPDDPAAWGVGVEERPIEELEVEAKWHSGHGIDKRTGGLAPNSNEEMNALREQIRTRYPHLVAR